MEVGLAGRQEGAGGLPSTTGMGRGGEDWRGTSGMRKLRVLGRALWVGRGEELVGRGGGWGTRSFHFSSLKDWEDDRAGSEAGLRERERGRSWGRPGGDLCWALCRMGLQLRKEVELETDLPVISLGRIKTC